MYFAKCYCNLIIDQVLSNHGNGWGLAVLSLSRLQVLHSCPHATVHWSPMGGGTRHYLLNTPRPIGIDLR